ncbi:MAG: cobalamin biosynthesis protein, partial [Planctomycetota bacterium]|nr:cobalamin biosynthesis protein [Planctomycetota bacterium]
MKCALVALSKEAALLAARTAREFPSADVFVHEAAGVPPHPRVTRFSSIMALTARIFRAYDGLVYYAPCGMVVRALAPHVKHKLSDPAVVAVDAGGRFAISLLSGHEGGANELALCVANIIGAEPVVTTTTEALKTAIVGVGCRRGVPARRIVSAIRKALTAARVPLRDVRLRASA